MLFAKIAFGALQTDTLSQEEVLCHSHLLLIQGRGGPKKFGCPTLSAWRDIFNRTETRAKNKQDLEARERHFH